MNKTSIVIKIFHKLFPWRLILLDTNPVFDSKNCSESDYETIEISDKANSKNTHLGSVLSIKKLKSNAACQNDDSIMSEPQFSNENQTCTQSDYTCSYLYDLDLSHTTLCKFNAEKYNKEKKQLHLSWFNEETKRWPHKIPDNKCINDLPWYREDYFAEQNSLVVIGDGYGQDWSLQFRTVQRNVETMYRHLQVLNILSDDTTTFQRNNDHWRDVRVKFCLLKIYIHSRSQFSTLNLPTSSCKSS